ncbi:ABC transporter ATP-binding protein [Paracoccus sulfuroxidans]|uniref:Putative ABC transport system ATP-binding protein n=1 Tax=Paracoccus sulfuroxidans TaxID=384678 RepID=A0A562NX38_9RHOB|nr:ATP-binding cassette domain-containing protein [Paracoccus sulfuroxidans]TWI36725.1 putative ABC transport system ATP-binding protein [Paracoccus sulfuroxidans]
MSGQGARLELRDLYYGFAQDEPLVTLDSLDLTPGQVVVLTGPSGSGKTTLLYLLSGLLVPVGGRVSWDGTDLAILREGARDQWRRQNAGFVFQDFHLIPQLSPLENVLIPAGFSAFSTRALRTRAQMLLTRFGVPARRRAALLSRGEQQRVALARALLGDPRVIFADEPTASLDAASGQVVAQALRDLAHREGRTVIIASHDPTVIEIADLGLRLSRGRRVEPA